jgi:hypothetical protein
MKRSKGKGKTYEKRRKSEDGNITIDKDKVHIPRTTKRRRKRGIERVTRDRQSSNRTQEKKKHTKKKVEK